MLAGWKHTLAVGALLTAGLAVAEASDPQLDDYGAFGIDRTNGQLVVYRFDENNQASHEPIGTLHHNGAELTGIQGATHVPVHTGMFYAFWTNGDGQTHLVHVIPSQAADNELVAALRPIEGGTVTGAASFMTDDGPRTFILQRESIIPTYEISGRININPNNAEHMRFEFQRVNDETGQVLIDIDRDDLHDGNGIVDGNGHLVVFDDGAGEDDAYEYETHTTTIQLRPKALDAQGEIEIVSDAGEQFEVHNSNTYNLTGRLRIRIYNDHVNHQGRAMGKWWIDIEGQAEFEQSEVGTMNRVAELRANTLVPEVIEAAVLDEALLASLDVDPANLIGLGGRVNGDGEIEVFVADSHQAYRVQIVETSGGFDADNPIVDTEPLTLPEQRDLVSLDFAGMHLAGVDSYSSGRFVVLDVDGSDTLLHSTNKPGSDTLGAITFLPIDLLEAMLRPNYD